MEHHAGTYSQSPCGSIFLLQRAGRQLHLPLHGRTSGRTHRMDAERTSYHVTGMSIHAAAGTSNYMFIWGMAGENLDYGDMDKIKYIEMR